jgi:hypothetical protein
LVINNKIVYLQNDKNCKHCFREYGKCFRNFNVVKTMGEVIHGLPTLIIDYNYVEKNYPNFDIGTNCLSKDLYWTFKKTKTGINTLKI